MNIALIGYGKMGHAIEQIAERRGHKVVLRVTTANKGEIGAEDLRLADVVIEFTSPDSAKENVLKCISAGVNVISGTTGWNNELEEVRDLASEGNVAFLHASNFSVGVNIFFEVNKLLASLMNGREDYSVSIEETHHTQKKDAPSGTAITLAEQIVEHMDNKRKWALNDFNNREAVPIVAHRVENVPGTHKVTYSSAIDNIDIVHTAHSRDGFALGAVLAAEYIIGKKGVFSMKDVLGINK
jgi:4-hydroxy-tetrahydrodipicolinate reductase